MKTTKNAAVVVALSALLSTGRVSGGDWPQWRGPHRDGHSKETGLLQEWPKEGPKLIWQVKDLGGGYSTPSVVGERIYVLANKGLDDEFVKALHVKDGSEAWSTRIGKVGNPNQRPNYPAARSTPTVDGDVLYALGSDGDLACLETATGKIRWSKSLRDDFGGKPGEWAYAESPLVDGAVVVCTPGGSKATVAALDKRSGSEVWKASIPGGSAAGYSSIVIAETGGVKQYVSYAANGVAGIDAKSGKVLWQYDKTKGSQGMSIITPVARDDFVYTGAGRVGGGAVKLTASEGTVKAEQAYFDTKLPTAIGGAVLVGDHLYGCGGQALVCADFKTGKILWTERSVAPGSLCYADGRLYVHGESGEMALVEAIPGEYRERGRFTPPSPPARSNQRERAWAYPAIADGKLYVRDADCLWCYDIKAQ